MGNFAPCPSCRNRSGTWNGTYCTACHHGTKPIYDNQDKCACGEEPVIKHEGNWKCADFYGRSVGPVYEADTSSTAYKRAQATVNRMKQGRGLKEAMHAHK